ncbi:MAG TPA: hypothetical protein VGG70_05820 [Candidatus Cybelea sp.]
MESHTRRGVSGILAASLLAAVCTAGVVRAGAEPAEQRGTFVLLGGTPKISAKLWVSRPAGLSGTLNIRQFTADGKPILDYDVDMERVMHMIVVRDDFATFDHLHPNFDTATGTFSQGFTREPNHRYYVYADSAPHGLPQQVFRFTLDSAGPDADSRPSLAPSDSTARAESYSITLSETTLAAGQAENLNLTILANSQPARDLAPYLGAAAHLVFINTSTLAYVHLHPTLRGTNDESASMASGMNMAMATEGKAGPFMAMAVPALPAGTYKLWVQFLGNGKLYTVPFTLLAR